MATPTRTVLLPAALLLFACSPGTGNIGGPGGERPANGDGPGGERPASGDGPVAVRDTSGRPPVDAGPGGALWSAAYTPAWTGFSPSLVPWASVTHLMYFAILPNTDGSIDTHWIASGASAAMCAAAHSHHRKCMITVGGYGFGTRYAGATTSAVRPTFESNIIAYMKANGFDGMDLDWEDGMVASQYLALAEELRTRFDAMSPRPLLSLAHECWINVDPSMFQYFDMIDVMSYGTTVSGMAGELSCYTGVPHARMGIGMGLACGGVDKTPADVTAKCDYAKADGYGGVMEWTIDADYGTDGPSMPLLAAIAPYVPPP